MKTRVNITHPPLVPNLYEFLSSVEHEISLFEKYWWATDFHSIFFHIMEVNGYRQLLGYQYSWKYILQSTEERNCWNILKPSKLLQNYHFQVNNAIENTSYKVGPKILQWPCKLMIILY